MIVSRDEETIIAQCTPRGSGSLALLRLSGDNAINIADLLTKLPKIQSLQAAPSHTIHYGWVVDKGGAKVDQVMISILRAPRTFTGQDTIEITCHNNQFIIEEIIALAIGYGARHAQAGEFSQRALLHGKIDLVQAEALNELIHAQSQQALKKSLAQLEGTLSQWITHIEGELVRSLAWCEASFEFLDEEQEFGDQIKEHLQGLLKMIEHTKKTFDNNQHLRQGVRIAMIGSVNAGKSSLFNSLLGHKRSIVTNIPGTTRDTIETGVYRKGLYWTLIDTAGIRPTDDIIEAEGIERSLAEGKKADIIVLVFDGSAHLTEAERAFYVSFMQDYQHKTILVHNKADLAGISNLDMSDAALRVSALSGEEVALVECALQAKINALFGHALEAPFLLNERHYKLLLGLEKKLSEIVSMLSGVTHYELVSFHLRQALEHVTELTGKSISEAGLDAVFREFCVGK